VSNQLLAPLLSLIPAAVYAGLAGAFRPDPALRAAWRRGPHIARSRGDGSDFHEHRHYEPGDDLRRLDWRAIARHEKNVVRETQREVLAPLLVVVDAGGSMAYGDETASTSPLLNKWRTTQALAAALLAIVRKHGDPIGALVSSNGRVFAQAARPSLRVDQIQLLAQALREKQCLGVCDWNKLFVQIRNVDLHNTTVVIISDFLDFRQQADEDPEERDRWFARELSRLRSQALALNLVQVLHRDEITFPFATNLLGDDVIELHDPHGLAPMKVGQAEQMRATYLQRMYTHLERQHLEWSALGIGHYRHVSDEPLARTILDLAARNPASLAALASDGTPLQTKVQVAR
jgi:uncharacterized protein (DUF58 family)